MTKRIPQPRAELSAGIRTHEAKLLATMLRTSRLTFVFGEPGTDTTPLLKSGVMPLLQRRFADRAALPGTGEARPLATDLRRAAAGGLTSRRIEAAIYVDGWGEDPLADLKARIGDIAPATARTGPAHATRLADLLQQLNRQSGLQIVFLLDRFEDFLAAPAGHEGVTRFWAELVQAIQQPDLPASFLIALDESARPGLEHLRNPLPGFDHNSLRLSPMAAPSPPQPPTLPMSTAVLPGGAENPPAAGQDAGGVAVAVPTVPPVGVRPRRRGPPPREPIKVEDVYAFIEATLTRTAVQPAGQSRVRPADEEQRPAAPGQTASRFETGSSTPSLPLRPPRASAADAGGGIGHSPAAPVLRDEIGAGNDAGSKATSKHSFTAALTWIRDRRRAGR